VTVRLIIHSLSQVLRLVLPVSRQRVELLVLVQESLRYRFASQDVDLDSWIDDTLRRGFVPQLKVP
jgi:hypothetical protein